MKLYTQHLSPLLLTQRQAKPIAEINITPLIGVLMVLLVVLVITSTAPLQMVILNMPSRQTGMDSPETVVLQINAQGIVMWDGAQLEKPADLAASIALAAAQKVQPEIVLQIAPDTPYASVVRVLMLAKKAGLQKVEVLN